MECKQPLNTGREKKGSSEAVRENKLCQYHSFNPVRLTVDL